MKLIATTTWNCRRIIAAFLDYHMALGFDRILVMDFDSTDGTRDILFSDAYKSFVEPVSFPGITDLDSSNIMLSHMQARFDPASICLFCDPDEFLVLDDDKSVDDLLASYTQPLEIKRYNATGLRSQAHAESANLHPFGSFNIRINQQCHRSELEKISGVLSSPWIFSEVGPKILIRISDAVFIAGGDHTAVVRGPVPQGCGPEIYLLHFPILSFAEFERRVSSSRVDFAANPTLPVTFGWHSRRWIRCADEGRLWPEYLSAFIADVDLQRLLKAGSISIDNSIVQRLQGSPTLLRREEMSDVAHRPQTSAVALRPTSRNIYIVVGMHRSGTSLCSSILHVLGVDMASDRLIDFGNEHGHWERPEIVAIQDMMLNSMGRNFFSDAHDFPLPPGWWRMPELIPHIKRLSDLVSEAMVTGAPFGFKDPRTVKLLPIWTQICARLKLQPKFIICVRNPAHVVQSLNLRDGLDRLTGEYRWLDYTVDCFRQTNGYASHAVHYEDWFSDPIGTLNGLRDFLGSDFALPADEAFMATEPLIHPDANHGNPGRQEVALSLVRHFYDLVRNSSGSTENLGKIEAFCSDFHSYRQLLFPFQKKNQKQQATLQAEVERQNTIAVDMIAGKDIEIVSLRHALSLATEDTRLGLERLEETEIQLSAARRSNAASIQILYDVMQKIESEGGIVNEAVHRAFEELFSEEWYLNQNPDVRAAHSTGIEHYLKFGRYEERDPHPRWAGTSKQVSSVEH